MTDDKRYDEMWPGGPVFICDATTFRPGTDSVLLASFAAGQAGSASAQIGRRPSAPNGRRPSAPNGRRACDLGCGTGVVALLLAWQDKALTVDGIEIQSAWAALARENIKLNGLDSRVGIIDGDLRQHRNFLKSGAYDLVIANPPYYPRGSGKSALMESLASAREERECAIADLAAAAAYLTRWGGRFALVHKPERLAEIIRVLSQTGLEPKRLRFVQYRADSAPSLILLESRRGGNPSLTVEPPLILTDSAGNDSEEVKRIYHRE